MRCFYLHRLVVCLLGTALAVRCGAMGAQGLVAPQTTVAGELGSLASQAALVFAGQVTLIERRGGVVQITFHVEQQVVGAPGASYTLREWAGLWPPGQMRYFVGERALLFLHAASGAGLASPVDGSEGVVPLLVQGADAPELVDVRRLAASIQRAPGTPLPTEADGAIQFPDAIAVIQAAAAASASPTAPPAGVSSGVAHLPLPRRRLPMQVPAVLASPTIGPYLAQVPSSGRAFRPELTDGTL